MALRRTGAVLLVLAWAGCADPTQPHDASDPLAPPFLGALLQDATGRVSNATAGLRWNGTELWTEGEREHRFAFTWTAPEGFWEKNPGAVEVSIAWNTREGLSYDFVRANNRLNMRVEDAQGRVIAERDYANQFPTPFGSWPVPLGAGRHLPQITFIDPYSVSHLLPNLASGTYQVVVHVVAGRATYEGIVQYEPTPAGEPVGDLLPNVVTLPPLDVTLDMPAYFQAADPDLSAAGIRGCSAEEVVFKNLPRRCLRFSNGIGNAGPGPLTVALKESPFGATAQERPMFQYIQQSDGTYRNRPAGTGQFHLHHFHVHYLPISEFALYKFDPATNMRGERVTSIVKNGFNPVDEGLLQLGLPHTAAPLSCYSGTPADAQWVLCISSSWYDLYELDRYENYVEITGVPDGVYELVTHSNPKRLLEETNYEDNEGSAILRLTGNRVDVLERRWGLPGEPALR